MGGLFDRNPSDGYHHGHLRRLRRLFTSWISHRPIISGCLVFFCAILALLGARIYLNGGNPEHIKAQSDLVNKMTNYNPTSTNVAVVLPKTRSDDIRWLQKYIKTESQITPFIYSMSKRREKDLLIPRSSRGREVSAYLSYVLDYYEKLPPVSIFIHAGEEQRHNDLFGPKTQVVLKNLRLEAVEAKGYLNLRCMHSPGCPSHAHPNNPTASDIENRDARAYLAQIYRELFGADKTVPDVLGGVCCAQFAVSRDQIRRRPKSDYERMMRWVDEGSKKTVNSYGVGWVFEIVWHVVFSMEAVHCPVYEQCRCDNYGWCGPLSSGETLTPVAAFGNATREE
ncbi:unnamed protein product [Penicillium olsonii]|nr:unnamed protein product [Penicillium olsonii]